MANWTVALSLNVLLSQFNAAFPDRNKASDGSIGDENHKSRDSDHNAWWNNTVTARDFTHDPDGGIDIDEATDQLVASRDPRIKYIIANGMICMGGEWVWRPYTGANAHRHHFHLSVKANSTANDTRLWNLPMFVGKGQAVGVQPSYAPRGGYLRRGSQGPEVRRWQEWCNANYSRFKPPLVPDSDFGQSTERRTKEIQEYLGLVVDGQVGTNTRNKTNFK